MSFKILHYLRNLGLGGTEKTCQLFFEHTNSAEFESAVVYERMGQTDRLEEFTHSKKVCNGQMFVVDSYQSSSDYPDSKPLADVINTFKPDILHVYRSGYPEFPEVGVHVEVPHFVETNVFGFIDRNPRIDRSLFMSKWLMDAATRGLKHPRFNFINNPVEEPYSDEKLSVRKWITSKEAILLGRCGRPDNGIYNSINVEAAHLLRLQGYDIRFIVVAPPSNMVKDLINYEIPFHIIQPTTNPLFLSMFYNTIDIYAHARADGETFGVNIAEAMMHGKPVVTHIATPSIPGMGVFQAQTQLVSKDVGFIVNNNAAEYAEALKRLIDDAGLRKTMGLAAQHKAMSEFHVDVCTRKLENIYREVINEQN